MDEACAWWSALANCAAGRLPPMAPEKFGAILGDKTFTNGADCDMVKEKYAKTFEEVLATTEVLEFDGLKWGQKEFEVVAEALPACHALKVLNLGINNPGKVGIRALAAALPRCDQLMDLRLVQCQLKDGDAEAIFESATKCRKISFIEMSYNDEISPSGVAKIAALVPRIPTLRTVFLAKATVGDAGPAVAEMIAKSTSLEQLDLTNCKMTAESEEKIRAAWKAAGKPSNLLFM